MRTLYALSALLVLSIFLAGAPLFSGESGYRIKLKVDGIQDSVCYLAYHYGDKQYMADTAAVSPNGTCVFEGDEALPGGIYLIVLPNKKYFEVLISEQHFSIETDADDPVGKMSLKKSHENKLFYDFVKFSKPYNQEREELAEDLKEMESDSIASKPIRERLIEIDKLVMTEKKKIIEENPHSFYANLLKATIVPELPEPDKAKTDSTYRYTYYKNHFLDNLDFSDQRLLRTPVMKSQIDLFLDKYNYPMPDSLKSAVDLVLDKSSVNEDVYKFAAIMMVNKYANSKIMGQDEVYVYLVDQLYGGGKAFWADSAQLKKMNDRSKAIKPTLIGKIAPNIAYRDPDGKDHNLHKIEAKRTILYFWDAKCGHCKKVTPKLVEVYKKYEEKDVAIFTMCTSTDKEKWKEAKEQVGIYWEDIMDPYNRSRFRQNYDITSTPRLFLLDENKKILAKRIGVEQLEEMLEKAFETEN